MMNPDDLLQPTIFVSDDLAGHRRMTIAWPDPDHKPRFVRILPTLLEEIVEQLNELLAHVCEECREYEEEG